MLDLSKGNSEALVSASGRPVLKLYVGVGWDTSSGGKKGFLGKLKRAQGTDLDVCAVVFDAQKTPIRMAWFDNLNVFDGAITLSGDNTTGKGDGDDESIVADLSKLPRGMGTIVFIVSAYKEGVTFSKVENVTCRLVDQTNGGGGEALGEFYPPIDSTQSAIVLAKVQRQADQTWQLTPVNEMGSGKSKDQLMRLAASYVS